MKNKTKLTTLLSFLPAIIIMLMIFGFSSEDSVQSTSTSQSFTKNVVSIVDSTFKLDLPDRQQEIIVYRIEHFIRKLAHFTEYLLLAISIITPLYFQKIRGQFLVLATESFCFLYAVTDEFHQLFISGRSASAIDVLIDSFGALTGISIIVLIIYLRNKSKLSK